MKLISAILFLIIYTGSFLALSQPALSPYWLPDNENTQKDYQKNAAISLFRTGFQIRVDPETSELVSFRTDNLDEFSTLLRKRKNRMIISDSVSNELLASLERNEIRDQLVNEFFKFRSIDYYKKYQSYLNSYMNLNTELSNDSLRTLFKNHYDPESMLSSYMFYLDSIYKESASHENSDNLTKKQSERYKYYLKKGKVLYKKHHSEKKGFYKYLKGKKSNPIRGLKVWQLDFPVVIEEGPGRNHLLSFVSGKDTVGGMRFYSKTVILPDRLPMVDHFNCVPFNRYSYFKQAAGLGLENIGYRPYFPRSSVLRQKKFTIQFSKNESDADYFNLQEITQFMADSNYVILKAKVLAFASVEGNTENNLRLQTERAGVLLKLLENVNNEAFEIDSIGTAESWKMFYEQIENTKFDSLIGKPEETIKQYLEDEIYQAKLESFLQKQRHADLYLLLTERLDTVSKVKFTLRDIQKVSRRINKKLSIRKYKPEYGVLAGMVSYLENTIRNMPDLRIKCDEIRRSSEYAVNIASFYSALQDHREGLEPVCSDYLDIIMNAFDGNLLIIQRHSGNRARQNYFVKQGVDIQLFTFDLIKTGQIPNDIYCYLEYPDQPAFYSLILNRIRFAESDYNHIASASCFQGTRLGESPILKFDDVSRYYYYLKKRILYKDKNIESHVIRSDRIYEYDLYEFLQVNVHNWNHIKNELFDPEIDIEKMRNYLIWLMKNSNQCKTQLFELYLNYYMKASFQVFHDPDKLKESREAVMNLAGYYRRRQNLLSFEDLRKINEFFLFYNRIYFRNEMMEYNNSLYPKLSIN